MPPSEQQIAARIAVLKARDADFRHALPGNQTTTVSDEQWREWALDDLVLDPGDPGAVPPPAGLQFRTFSVADLDIAEGTDWSGSDEDHDGHLLGTFTLPAGHLALAALSLELDHAPANFQVGITMWSPGPSYYNSNRGHGLVLAVGGVVANPHVAEFLPIAGVLGLTSEGPSAYYGEGGPSSDREIAVGLVTIGAADEAVTVVRAYALLLS